jgi:hypothetical protein
MFLFVSIIIKFFTTKSDSFHLRVEENIMVSMRGFIKRQPLTIFFNELGNVRVLRELLVVSLEVLTAVHYC